MLKRSLLLLSLVAVGVQALQGTCYSCMGGVCMRRVHAKHVLAKVAAKKVCKPCARRRVCRSCSGGVCRRPVAKHVAPKAPAKHVASKKTVKARKPVRRCHGGCCYR